MAVGFCEGRLREWWEREAACGRRGRRVKGRLASVSVARAGVERREGRDESVEGLQGLLGTELQR